MEDKFDDLKDNIDIIYSKLNSDKTILSNKIKNQLEKVNEKYRPNIDYEYLSFTELLNILNEEIKTFVDVDIEKPQLISYENNNFIKKEEINYYEYDDNIVDRYIFITQKIKNIIIILKYLLKKKNVNIGTKTTISSLIDLIDDIEIPIETIIEIEDVVQTININQECQIKVKIKTIDNEILTSKDIYLYQINEDGESIQVQSTVVDDEYGIFHINYEESGNYKYYVQFDGDADGYFSQSEEIQIVVNKINPNLEIHYQDKLITNEIELLKGNDLNFEILFDDERLNDTIITIGEYSFDVNEQKSIIYIPSSNIDNEINIITEETGYYNSVNYLIAIQQIKRKILNSNFKLKPTTIQKDSFSTGIINIEVEDYKPEYYQKPIVTMSQDNDTTSTTQELDLIFNNNIGVGTFNTDVISISGKYKYKLNCFTNNEYIDEHEKIAYLFVEPDIKINVITDLRMEYDEETNTTTILDEVNIDQGLIIMIDVKPSPPFLLELYENNNIIYSIDIPELEEEETYYYVYTPQIKGDIILSSKIDGISDMINKINIKII